MDHVKALIMKFIMCTAVLWIVLGLLYGADFGEILTISVILTLASYAIGDLLVLRSFNNVVATIADFGLSFIMIWLIGLAIIDEPMPIATAAFLSAIVITVGEWFFHQYMKNRVFDDENKDDRTIRNNDTLATEFAEEPDVHGIDRENMETSPSNNENKNNE